jgi:hypothetical protein
LGNEALSSAKDYGALCLMLDNWASSCVEDNRAYVVGTSVAVSS